MVRISWDEALDIVASESKRIKENMVTSLFGSRVVTVLISKTFTPKRGFVGDWEQPRGEHGLKHQPI